MTSRATKLISAATAMFGSIPAIILSFSLVAAWFAGGMFVEGHFANNTYQLLINTGTTIVTFWMVFIIQNTQNRDGRAIQTKLDAIIEALDAADNRLIGLEELSDHDIKERQQNVRAAHRD